MKNLLTLFAVLMIAALQFIQPSFATPLAPKNTGYFILRVYHYTNAAQEHSLDSFLQNKYVPFLHSSKINNVGVFKAIANDTSADKKMYVFIPFKSLKQWDEVSAASVETMITGENGYAAASYKTPSYSRFETILLKAFPLMPAMAASKLTAPKSERVYELRSYEGPSEKYFRNKVKMFNEGGEIDLFARLGFNAVFYSEVVFGSKMPNLMYMTSFENMQSREDHWKAFVNDPVWKKISTDAEYQNNVSHSDIYFLRSTSYSDL